LELALLLILIEEFSDKIAFLGSVRPSDSPVHLLVLRKRNSLAWLIGLHDVQWIRNAARDKVLLIINGNDVDKYLLKLSVWIFNPCRHEEMMLGRQSSNESFFGFRISLT